MYSSANLPVGYVLTDPTNYVCLPCLTINEYNDLVVKSSRRYVIGSGQTITVKTGLTFVKFHSVTMTVDGGQQLMFYTEGEARSRPGLFQEHGLRVIAPLSITSHYDQELEIMVTNESKREYVITKGEGIALIHFTLTPKFEFPHMDDTVVGWR